MATSIYISCISKRSRTGCICQKKCHIKRFILASYFSRCNFLAASADQLSQLLGLMLLKELVDGSGRGGGGASPKMLVAVAAKGEAAKVRELVTKYPRWVRISIRS